MQAEKAKGFVDPEMTDRINKAIKERYKTKAKFAAIIGATYEAVRLWCDGQSKPSSDFLASIAKNTTISVDWLLTGKEPLSSRPPQIIIQQSPHLKTFHRDFAMDNYIPVKLLKDAVAAGNPSEINEKDIAGWVLIYADKQWSPGDPENYTCCHVRGRSMYPILNDGDIIAINHSEKDPKKLDKKMVAFRQDGGATIKWLKVLPNNVVVGVPENKDDFDSVVSLRGEEINTGIIGKVAWWWAKR